jgi:hypothetical protein
MGRRWCENDPIMRIDGEIAHIKFWAESENSNFATGDITILAYGVKEIDVSKARVFGQKIQAEVYPDEEFGFSVWVPADEEIEVRILIEPAGQHDIPVLFGVGMTNNEIYVE